MDNELLLRQSRDLITNLTEALQKTNTALIQKTEEVKELKEQNKTYERISNRNNWFDGKEIAKILNYKGYGRNTIFVILRDRGIFDLANQPKQQYVNNGYFKLVIKENEYNGSLYSVPLASVKGIDFIRRILEETTADISDQAE